MSPMIYLDGAEKAGKTTICQRLVDEYGATYRHFGIPDVPPTPFDLLFFEQLVEDVERAKRGELIVWDRGWASDHVYGSLMGRTSRLTLDPWLGEWLYGRVVRTVGVAAIITGPSDEAVEALRTADDQPVRVTDERASFLQYGISYAYDYSGPSQHDSQWQQHFIGVLLRVATFRQQYARLSPPDYVGPLDPAVLIVGERRNTHSSFPGAYAPFTSPTTTKFARHFGNSALSMGWTNADVVTDDMLRAPRVIVACGKQAAGRIRGVRGDYIFVPHPSWSFRWGFGQTDLDAMAHIAGRVAEIQTL